jgi:ATP-dependent DNA ligase
MLASPATKLPTGAGWSYEVKFDGYRTLALKDCERVKLLSRNLKDATKLYPAVAREVAKIRDDAVLLDGEVVAVDEQGRPSSKLSTTKQLTRSSTTPSICSISMGGISRRPRSMNAASCSRTY